MPSPAPHRRRNLLTGEWVLVSAQRTARPWQGQLEQAVEIARPAYDANCYLCPGNSRANGETNPYYTDTHVFDNDFPALLQQADQPAADDPLLVMQTETGRCRVLCFSPRHDLTLATMDVDAVLKLVDAWTAEYATLGSDPAIKHVQIFENKGAMMGCSNPHPHGQIWAQSSIPGEPRRELAEMQRHYASSGSPLLIDYLDTELDRNERIVLANASFVALVPFWATWPFEILLLPRQQRSSLLELDARERRDLAAAVREINIRFDNLFQASFPYSAGLHQAPTDGGTYEYCTLHMHFFPPLLRSAKVRKFMVGYEMLAEPQRDITPEASAQRLREAPAVHFTESGVR